jgi:hypothetical protein
MVLNDAASGAWPLCGREPCRRRSAFTQWRGGLPAGSPKPLDTQTEAPSARLLSYA